MKVSDMVCPVCRSIYLRRVRVCARPEAGQFSCTTCGEIIARWHTAYVPIYTKSERPALVATKPVEPPRNTKFGFAEAIVNEIFG